MWRDIKRQRNCHRLVSRPYSPTTSRNFNNLAFLKHFRMLATNRGQKLRRTLTLPQYHVPLSCHFISVMTHRFSIYARNCIEAGRGPSQSQAGPAVHLGKRRWLNWLGGGGGGGEFQTWFSLLAPHLSGFPPFFPHLPQGWEEAGGCASPRFGGFSPLRYVTKRCGWLRAGATDGLGNVDEGRSVFTGTGTAWNPAQAHCAFPLAEVDLVFLQCSSCSPTEGHLCTTIQ